MTLLMWKKERIKPKEIYGIFLVNENVIALRNPIVISGERTIELRICVQFITFLNEIKIAFKNCFTI